MGELKQFEADPEGYNPAEVPHEAPIYLDALLAEEFLIWNRGVKKNSPRAGVSSDEERRAVVHRRVLRSSGGREAATGVGHLRPWEVRHGGHLDLQGSRHPVVHPRQVPSLCRHLGHREGRRSDLERGPPQPQESEHHEAFLRDARRPCEDSHLTMKLLRGTFAALLAAPTSGALALTRPYPDLRAQLTIESGLLVRSVLQDDRKGVGFVLNLSKRPGPNLSRHDDEELLLR
jgi:hypothetical protein